MAKYVVYVQGKPVEVSKEVYDYLTKSDNHIKYIEKTRKREQVIIDNDYETITFNPSREEALYEAVFGNIKSSGTDPLMSDV